MRCIRPALASCVEVVSSGNKICQLEIFSDAHQSVTAETNSRWASGWLLSVHNLGPVAGVNGTPVTSFG